MAEIDPDLLLRAYSIGVFPMADSRDAEELFWVEPKPAGDHSARAASASRARSARWSARARSRSPATPPSPRSSATARSARRPGSTAEIERATTSSTARGHAHSIECWQDGALVGGLYGVTLGAAFFGESMFSLTHGRFEGGALAWLVARLRVGGYRLARLPVHDRASAQPRRGRDRPGGLCALLSGGPVGSGAPGRRAERPAAARGRGLGRRRVRRARPAARRRSGADGRFARFRDASSRSSWARRRRPGARRR